MSFEIGQIFENGYSPEVADWCNENNAYIDEIEPLYEEFEREDGVLVTEPVTRRFQIVAIPEPTQEEKQAQTQAQLTQAIQNHLDTKAQELNYDSCLSVCSYIDTGVEKFDAEGRAFRAWRSAVWNKGYEILNACLAGEREIPTEAELIAELPELNVDYS